MIKNKNNKNNNNDNNNNDNYYLYLKRVTLMARVFPQALWRVHR